MNEMWLFLHHGGTLSINHQLHVRWVVAFFPTKLNKKGWSPYEDTPLSDTNGCPICHLKFLHHPPATKTLNQIYQSLILSPFFTCLHFEKNHFRFHQNVPGVTRIMAPDFFIGTWCYISVNARYIAAWSACWKFSKFEIGNAGKWIWTGITGISRVKKDLRPFNYK